MAIVLSAPQIDASRDFLIDVLGFGVSDYMVHRPLGAGGPAARIDFMHCANARHHSLALFEGDVPSGCVHMMVEVPDLDEVGRAYDACSHPARLMATLGKHTNDHMTSFCRNAGRLRARIRVRWAATRLGPSQRVRIHRSEPVGPRFQRRSARTNRRSCQLQPEQHLRGDGR
jgi:hypothetical protein